MRSPWFVVLIHASGCLEEKLPEIEIVDFQVKDAQVKDALNNQPDAILKSPVSLNWTEDISPGLKRYTGQFYLGNCNYGVEGLMFPPISGISTLRAAIEPDGYPVPDPNCPSPRDIIEWGFNHYKGSKQ